jgi:lysozyme family protein
MISPFEEALSQVFLAEGGFSIDPDDPGNWTKGRKFEGKLLGTKYGISAASFPHLNIPRLTKFEAGLIYQDNYWIPLRLDDVALYSRQLALMLFTLGVNCGTGRAARFLQIGINRLNFSERLNLEPLRYSRWQQKILTLLNGKPLKEDGKLGPLTLEVLNQVPYRAAVCAAVFGEAYIHYSGGKLIYRAGWLNRLGSGFLR